MQTRTSDVVSFILPIDPMPAPRPRCTARGGFASIYDPTEYKAWKKLAIELLKEQPQEGPPALRGEALVSVEMTVRVLKARTSKLKTPTGDVDNYAKGVLDAMTQSELWWADDKQVVDLRVRKRFAEPDEEAGIEVTVQYL